MEHPKTKQIKLDMTLNFSQYPFDLDSRIDLPDPPNVLLQNHKKYSFGNFMDNRPETRDLLINPTYFINKIVMDVGCGTGKFLKEISRKYEC